MESDFPKLGFLIRNEVLGSYIIRTFIGGKEKTMSLVFVVVIHRYFNFNENAFTAHAEEAGWVVDVEWRAAIFLGPEMRPIHGARISPPRGYLSV